MSVHSSVMCHMPANHTSLLPGDCPQATHYESCDCQQVMHYQF